MNAARSPASTAPKTSRRRSREFAMQGLYQWQLAGTDAATIESHMCVAKGFDKIDRAYFSSLEMGRRLLVALGEPEGQTAIDIVRFREHDQATLLRQQAVYRDEKQLIQTAQESARELEQLFETDRAEGPER